jgi:hypothetical protein
MVFILSKQYYTLIYVMIRYFAGETLGVIYGFYCRNQKASFYKR